MIKEFSGGSNWGRSRNCSPCIIVPKPIKIAAQNKEKYQFNVLKFWPKTMKNQSKILKNV